VCKVYSHARLCAQWRTCRHIGAAVAHVQFRGYVLRFEESHMKYARFQSSSHMFFRIEMNVRFWCEGQHACLLPRNGAYADGPLSGSFSVFPRPLECNIGLHSTSIGNYVQSTQANHGSKRKSSECCDICARASVSGELNAQEIDSRSLDSELLPIH